MTRRHMLASSLVAALRRENWDTAVRLLEQQAMNGELAAAVLEVHSRGTTLRHSVGAAKTPDAVFLLASITKPMTATGVMQLVDRKEVSLTDPVRKFIPEFRGGDRDKVLVQHLLTHTSGLPDMLPDNDALRQRHAPLSEFVSGTCRTPLLFPPGTQVRYQSMGILLAAEIAARITGQPFPSFLHEQVFAPLGMNKTSLGLGGRAMSDTMLCQVKDDPDWNWNSPYWRNLGSPWGGAHSNTADISRFLHYFAHPDVPVLKPDTAAAMITNHNQGLKQPWGLGWMLGSAGFGKGSGATTFGHSGSTGTLAWLDPAKELSCVLLTTKPAVESGKTLLRPVADLVSEMDHR